MRKYEFIYILDPGLDEAAVAKSQERYVALIREQGGEVITQEIWGRRKFAYEIDHKTEGSYIYVRLQGLSTVVDELHRAIRFDEDVVRDLIVLDEEAELRNEQARRAREQRAAVATPSEQPEASA